MGVCLNMIVRDEAERIEACLASMAPHIEYAVIVDTGSLDGTVEIARAALQRLGISGSVHEREWTNFAAARQQALDLARGISSYILVADADQYLDASQGAFDRLTAPRYAYLVQSPAGSHRSARLVRDDPAIDWRWHYPVHEQLLAKGVEGAVAIDATMLIDGAGSLRTARYRRDIDTIRSWLAKHPGDEHMRFHLANSLSLNGQRSEAMGEWGLIAASTDVSSIGRERRYLSMVRLAECTDDVEARLGLMRTATALRPARWEAPFGMLVALRKLGRDTDALALADRLISTGLKSPRREALDVSSWVHEWGIRHVHALLCASTGRLDEAAADLQQLLATPSFPASKRDTAVENLRLLDEAR